MGSIKISATQLELKVRMKAVGDLDAVQEVEEWARCEGLGSLFRPPSESEKAATSSAWWPIPLTAAWILARNPSDAVEQWVRQKNWGRDLWRAAPWGVAQEGLWRKLEAERLAARGSTVFGGPSMLICSVEWRSLTWERYGQADLITRNHDHRNAYYDVVIDAAQAQKLWPAETPAVAKIASTSRVEERARKHLEHLMRDNPEHPTSKKQLRQDPRFQRLSYRSFDHVFTAAVRATKSAWSKAGRRPKSPHS